MPKKPKIEDLLRNNPQIDRQQLQASMELLEELKRRGVSNRGYQLATPFEGKQAQPVHSPENENELPSRN